MLIKRYHMKIDFESAKPKQTIQGYGASACWWSQNISNEKTAEEICDLLYSQKGLGLNIYRYNIGAGWDETNCRVDNPWRRCESFYVVRDEDEEPESCGGFDFSRDKNAYAFMKRCLEKGLIDTVVLFANSPHYSFTSSGQASGSLIHHTCNLPMANYEKYADYFLDITEHFLKDGIPVTYISPINEPQWKWGGKSVWQEGCHYEPGEVAQLFHIFAEKLEQKKLDGIKLYGPESGEIGGLTEEYLRLFKNDALIMKHLGAFAVHSYHADNDITARRDFYNNSAVKNPDIRFDMSEWCELPCLNDVDSIEGALITARIIGWDLCELGAQSWCAWVAANQISDCRGDGLDYSDGLITASDSFSHYKICKRYYALKHFTHFAPKGSQVLGNSENINDLHIFTFRTPDGGTSLIAVNNGKEAIMETDPCYTDADIAVTDSRKDFELIKGKKISGAITLLPKSITGIRLYGETP